MKLFEQSSFSWETQGRPETVSILTEEADHWHLIKLSNFKYLFHIYVVRVSESNSLESNSLFIKTMNKDIPFPVC